MSSCRQTQRAADKWDSARFSSLHSCFRRQLSRKAVTRSKYQVELLATIWHLLTMEKDLQEILSKLRELLPHITQKYQVNSIEVFGSYARNEQNKSSDLDILVTFTKTPGLIKFLGLKNFLSDQLQVNVDLVMKDSLKPRISPYIFNESIPV